MLSCKFSTSLGGFQTDNPIGPFFYLTLEDYCDGYWKIYLQIAEYKKKARYRESKVYTSCKEVTILYATTALHFMEKSLLKDLVVQYAVCFDPTSIVKNQDISVRGFGLISERQLSSKRWPSSKYVEETKEQYKVFVKDVVTSHLEKFDAFDMFQQRVNEF